MTPLIVTAFAPAAMIPVSVPPSVPAPVFRLKVTVVAGPTFLGVPVAVCDWTVTEKALPAVGVAGLIVVTASLPGVSTMFFPVTAPPLLLTAKAVVVVEK